MQQPLTEGVYYILLALYEPRHGYGIMQIVEEWSDGRVKLGAGTTYGALKNLQEKKFIETLAGEGRKKSMSLQRLANRLLKLKLPALKSSITTVEKLYKRKEICDA